MESLSLTAQEAYNSRKYKKAASLYKRMIEQEPKNGSFHQGLAQSLVKLRQYDAASSEARQAIQLDPGLAGAHAILGLTYYLQNNNEESQAELQKALELDPNLADTFIAIGAFEIHKHNFQESIAPLQKALLLSPNSYEAHFYLHIAYGNISEHKESVREIKIAYKLNPSFRVGIRVILAAEYYYRFWLALIFCIITLGPIVTRLIYILPIMIIFVIYHAVIGVYCFQIKYKRGVRIRGEFVFWIVLCFLFWYFNKGL